jgi:hypothetical protein
MTKLKVTKFGCYEDIAQGLVKELSDLDVLKDKKPEEIRDAIYSDGVTALFSVIRQKVQELKRAHIQKKENPVLNFDEWIGLHAVAFKAVKPAVAKALNIDKSELSFTFKMFKANMYYRLAEVSVPLYLIERAGQEAAFKSIKDLNIEWPYDKLDDFTRTYVAEGHKQAAFTAAKDLIEEYNSQTMHKLAGYIGQQLEMIKEISSLAAQVSKSQTVEPQTQGFSKRDYKNEVNEGMSK